MEYRLIASDIDGTLTDQWKEVIPRNREVIQELVEEKGVAFMIATGRSFKSARPILESLNVKCYACLVNGAVLLSYPDLQVIHTNYLSVEEKNLIMEKINLAGGSALMYNGFEGGDQFYYAPDYYQNKVINDIVSKTSDDERILVEDLIRDVNHPVPVVSCVGEEAQVDLVIKELEPMQDQFNILKLKENYNEGYSWLMITKKDVDKVHGIQNIANLLGVNREEIITIGDDLNDVEMVKYAGLGIAMGNAVEPLKEVADRIAPSCAEEGLAQIFAEIFEL